ncbi:DUF4333 domain-containing protein [Prauserella muralis]|uniref:DUF4333 domain-containing protein n=1 Tax=Prauserella muralis TaxID=588067 RepID=UPI0011BFA884|nr:DUF4333 domain-containing protein [Prauserella muralis]
MRVRAVVLLLLSAVLLLGACDDSRGRIDPGDPTTPAGSTATAAPSTASSASEAPAPTTSLSRVPRLFDPQSMQQSVQQVLSQAYGIEGVESVSCPAGQRVEVGTTFDCSARIDGEQKLVAITVRTADGRYEVGRPR